MIRYSKQLDWLSITIPVACANEKTVPFLNWRYRGKGKHGYAAIYSCDAVGATLETQSINPDMYTHLTLPGKATTFIRQIVGLTDDDLIAWTNSVQGRPSRLDMCMDIRGGMETPESLMHDVIDGTAKVKARTWHLETGKSDNSDIGSTFYIGSWHSDSFMRIYDKRAETNIVDMSAWVRFEIVTKNLKAIAAKNAIANVGAKEAIGAHIGNYLKWDSKEYQEGLNTTLCLIEKVEKRKLPRQQWLLGIVAKALANEITYNPEFEQEFMSAVHSFATELETNRI